MPRKISVAITSPMMQEKLGDILRKKNEKFYFLYHIALQSGIPVAVLLRMRIKDIRERKSINYTIRVTKYTAQLSNALQEELSIYCSGKDDDSPLFPGSQPDQPCQVLTVQRVVKYASEKLNLTDVTISSFRKTFFYNLYCQGNLTFKQFLTMTGHPSQEELKHCYGIEYQYPSSPESEEVARLFDETTLKEFFFKLDLLKNFLLSKDKIKSMTEAEYMEFCVDLSKLDNILYLMQKYIK